MLILKKIEITNFKSYLGHHIIGPFMHFTAIVGPNGSGKSNLMEALSFVLGVKINKLRVEFAKDLVYGEHVGRNDIKECSVKAVFEDDESEEYSIMRSITICQDVFRVNDKIVKKSNYKRYLENLGVYSGVHNFIVFQGDIESIVSESSKNRTLLIEKFSGSNKFIGPYEECEKKLKVEVDRFTCALRKKREAFTERRKLDMEKHEATKYNETQKKIDTLARDLVILNCLLTDETIQNLKREICENELSKHRIAEEIKLNRVLFNQAKSESVELIKNRNMAEKKMSEFDIKLKQLIPKKDSIASEIVHLETKITSDTRILERAENEFKKNQSLVIELKTSIKEAEKIIDSIEEQSNVYIEDKSLSKHIFDEYIKLKHDSSKSLPIQQNLRELIVTRDGLINDIQSVSNSICGLMKKQDAHVDNENDLRSRVERLNEMLANNERMLELKVDEHKLMEEKVTSAQLAVVERRKKLEKVSEALGVYKLDMFETARMRKLVEVGEKLKMYFSGVHGRLSELIEPIHRRYSVAITKVLGRNIDAFVVTDAHVAFECIEYLREQQLGREVFLPLSGLKSKRVDGGHRQLGGTAKMMLDVVRFEEAVRAAVEFVFGCTVVCDGVEEAHAISLNFIERKKVVTLDGCLFLKSGVISGGSLTLRRKARRWDERQMVELKGTRDGVVSEIQRLEAVLESKSRLEDAQLEINKMGQMVGLWTAEKQRLSCAIARVKQEMGVVAEHLVEMEMRKKTCGDRLSAMNQDIGEVEKEMKSVNRKLFEEFSVQHNISLPENFEETTARSMRESANRRLNCENHINLLKNQLQYEMSRFDEELRQTVVKRIADIEENIVELKRELKLIVRRIESISKELKEIKMQMIDIECACTGKLVNVKECGKVLAALEKQETVLNQDISTIQIKVEQAVNEKYNLLKMANAHSNIEVEVLRKYSVEFPEFGTQSQSTQVLEQQDRLISAGTNKFSMLVDTPVLGVEHLAGNYSNINSVEKIKETIEKIREEIDVNETILRKTTHPNHKALQQYDSRIEAVNKTAEEFNAAKAVVKALQKEFEEIKKSRTRLFITTFNEVAQKVDQIYKSLCNDSSAQAFVTLDDADEPYLGGVSYNCFPPKKRYQSIDKLSGGEKAMAALALLFALQSIQPAPFVVLDEVDAAFDGDNIQNLASYLRYYSKQNIPLIVISLKEDLYSHANALIGVTSDPSYEFTTSQLFSLNLDKFSD